MIIIVGKSDLLASTVLSEFHIDTNWQEALSILHPSLIGRFHIVTIMILEEIHEIVQIYASQ